LRIILYRELTELISYGDSSTEPSLRMSARKKNNQEAY
jgi:hypothetical protein